MTVSSSQQLQVFFLCIAFGLASGIVFDALRSVRKVYGHKNVLTITEDVFFLIVYIASLIVLCYFFDEGRIRYYHLLGALCGIMLYALLLSRIVLKALCTIHLFFIKNILSPFIKLLRGIFSPIKRAFLKMAAILKKQHKKIKRILKNINTKKKRMKKIIKML